MFLSSEMYLNRRSALNSVTFHFMVSELMGWGGGVDGVRVVGWVGGSLQNGVSSGLGRPRGVCFGRRSGRAAARRAPRRAAYQAAAVGAGGVCAAVACCGPACSGRMSGSAGARHPPPMQESHCRAPFLPIPPPWACGSTQTPPAAWASPWSSSWGVAAKQGKRGGTFGERGSHLGARRARGLGEEPPRAPPGPCRTPWRPARTNPCSLTCSTLAP